MMTLFSILGLGLAIGFWLGYLAGQAAEAKRHTMHLREMSKRLDETLQKLKS